MSMISELRELKVDIRITKIEGIVESLNAAITALTGHEGRIPLQKAKQEIENNLEGKAKEAMEKELSDIILEYDDSLANLEALKQVLLDYKSILRKGGEAKLHNIEDHIKLDMGVVYKEIDELDQVITNDHTLRKVMKSDEDFKEWQSKKEKAEVSFWGSTNEEGEWEEDWGVFDKKDAKKRAEIFEVNNKKFYTIADEIAYGLTKTKVIVRELEMESGLIAGELDGLKDIMDKFDYTHLGLLDWARATASFKEENIQRESRKEAVENISDKAKNLDFGVGISNYQKEILEKSILIGNISELTKVLNEILFNLSGIEEEEFLEKYLKYIEGLLGVFNLLFLTLYFDEDKVLNGITEAEIYDIYERLKMLEQAILAMLEYTKGKHLESFGSRGERAQDNEIMNISYNLEDRVLIINGSKKIKLGILDTDGEKLVEEGLTNWKIAVDEANEWINNLMFNVVKTKITESLIAIFPEVEVLLVGIENAFNVILGLENVISGYEKVEEEKLFAIAAAFGFEQNLDGTYYIDFKTIIIIDKYCRKTGNTSEDIVSSMDTPEEFADWLYRPSDPSNKKSKSNKGVLEDIRNEVEKEYGMIN